MLTSNKKTTFLISGVRFTYKFVIPDIKRKQNIFLSVFLKYWPSSCDLNKLVIKA
jgi:ubiquitin-protein ligase